METCPKCHSSNVEHKTGMSYGAAEAIATVGSIALTFGGEVIKVLLTGNSTTSSASQCRSYYGAQERIKKWKTALGDHHVCHNCGHKW